MASPKLWAESAAGLRLMPPSPYASPTFAVTLLTPVGVLGCKGVAPFAMGSPSVSRRCSISSQYVVAPRHRLKMIGINTDTVTTTMVNGQLPFEWSNENLPNQTMGCPRLARRGHRRMTEHAVAIRKRGPGPFPTIASGIDLRPKPNPIFQLPKRAIGQSQSHRIILLWDGVGSG